MRIKLLDGSVKILTDIRHIPDLKRNFISVGTLDKNGCSYKAEGGVLKVTRGSMFLMKYKVSTCFKGPQLMEILLL